MNLRNKIYQLFILGSNDDSDVSILKKSLHAGLGGVIFFTRDIISANQFKNLVKELENVSIVKPFFSIDQEGGRVERTENIHHGKKFLSAKYACEKGILKTQTQDIARELKCYGINLNFAPCVDVNTNPKNPIIGERAFSNSPDEVIKAGELVYKTYLQEGIIPCLKHYPGHGDANADSHKTLPQIDLALSEMEKNHIKPFKALVECPMIMAAHLHCTCFEKEIIPTSMSKTALDYLRQSLGYKGVIISDDMVMQGVSGFTPAQGLLAGLNMFIYRYSTPEIIDTIENLVKEAEKSPILREKIELSYKFVSELKNFLNF